MAIPKCGCGRYAAGECVDCDIPLCVEHLLESDDKRVRCERHASEREKVIAAKRAANSARGKKAAATRRVRARAEAAAVARFHRELAEKVKEVARRRANGEVELAALEAAPRVPFRAARDAECAGCNSGFYGPPIHEIHGDWFCRPCYLLMINTARDEASLTVGDLEDDDEGDGDEGDEDDDDDTMDPLGNYVEDDL